MKIYINGGLGNQLFQYSFAHSDQEEIELYLDKHSRLDRPFELKELIEYCRHNTNIARTNETLLNYRIKVQRIPVKLKIKFMNNVLSYFTKVNFEEKPFAYTSRVLTLKRALNLGYFQHWKNVEDNWNSFGNELLEYLGQIEVPLPLQPAHTQQIVLHVRQGDLVNVKHSMGVLASSYYSKSISEITKIRADIDFNYIFLTDDVGRATEVQRNLNLPSALILGPGQLNAWQTLKIMSESKYLICANSTLSWWAGFISAKKGGQVYFPEPWFKNWHEPVGDAFYFPECKTIQSTFI